MIVFFYQSVPKRKRGKVRDEHLCLRYHSRVSCLGGEHQTITQMKNIDLFFSLSACYCVCSKECKTRIAAIRYAHHVFWYSSVKVSITRCSCITSPANSVSRPAWSIVWPSFSMMRCIDLWSSGALSISCWRASSPSWRDVRSRDMARESHRWTISEWRSVAYQQHGLVRCLEWVPRRGNVPCDR